MEVHGLGFGDGDLNVLLDRGLEAVGGGGELESRRRKRRKPEVSVLLGLDGLTDPGFLVGKSNGSVGHDCAGLVGYSSIDGTGKLRP